MTATDTTARPRIKVHMGEAKTGTTTLQSILFNARETLQAQGIVYASSGKIVPNAIGHHMLPRTLWACDTEQPLETLEHWSDLRTEIEGYGPETTVLISSEGFSSLQDEKHARMIRAFFDGYDVEFHISLRQVDEWIESMYAQFVKAPPFTCTPFAKFTRKFGLRGVTATTLIADQFGDAAVKILQYDADVVPNMLAALGVTGVEVPREPKKQQNTTPPSVVNAAYLALNHVAMPQRDRVALYNQIAAVCQEHGQGAIKTKTAGNLPQFKFTPALHRDFVAQHRDEIETFCTRFGLPLESLLGDAA